MSTCEYVARCRSLRTAAHLLAGPLATTLCEALATAETEHWIAADALAALNALPSRTVREIVSTFGAIHCPGWSR